MSCGSFYLKSEISSLGSFFQIFNSPFSKANLYLEEQQKNYAHRSYYFSLPKLV